MTYSVGNANGWATARRARTFRVTTGHLAHSKHMPMDSPPLDESFYGPNLGLGRDAILSQAPTASLPRSSRAHPTTGATPYLHNAYVNRRRTRPGNLLDSAPERVEQGELAVQLAMIES
jgi:hypothetical protein